MNATGIEIPPAIVEGLNAGKRPKVTVTVNGSTYRSTVAVMGGRYMVGVTAEQRAKSGVKAGDLIEVILELDTAPREVEAPADLIAAAFSIRRRRVSGALASSMARTCSLR